MTSGWPMVPAHPPSRADLLDRLSDLNDECARLGMFAPGPVDEAAYACAAAKRDALERELFPRRVGIQL